MLVDEYQDIDPAQETLVQILAAPQDGLFAVGDEDQTLYAWRSASVERIVGLDGLYPGLQRVALEHNYRCPPEVVERSRRVIEHNRSRFPKPILPAAARRLPDDPRPVIHREYPSLEASAADVARKLSRSRRGEIVVLARTSRMLRICALACVPLRRQDLRARERLRAQRRARRAARPTAGLLGDVRNATPGGRRDGVPPPGSGPAPRRRASRWRPRSRTARRSRAPSRPCPAAADHARRRLAEGAAILDAALALAANAPRCLRFLRGEGGLDRHFSEYEALTGGVEKVEIELLHDAVKESAGMSVAAFAQRLTRESDALRAIRDDANGIELTTVHRAKGRQWPTVIVFGCDEDQMPHKRSLDDLVAGNADALEAERRIAYVAFTRAQQRLVVLTTAGTRIALLRRGRARRGPSPTARACAQPGLATGTNTCS